MAFVGSWKLTFNEGTGAIAKAMGTPDDVIAANKDFGNPACDVIEKITTDGSTMTMEVTIGGKPYRTLSIVVGKEVEAVGFDGRSGKNIVTVNGDTITRNTNVGGKEATFVRSVSGNEMTVQISGPDGTKGTRKYVKV